MILYYIRHGDPIYSPDSLTTLGHKQAEALSNRLVNSGIEAIYGSSSNRVILTAKPTCDKTGLKYNVEDWMNENYVWNEIVFVDSEGKKDWACRAKETCRIFNTDEIINLRENWTEHPRFKGTAFESGINRVKKNTDEFMLKLGYQNFRDERIYKKVGNTLNKVAVFAHYGFGSAFLSSLLDVPFPEFALRYDMRTTGMTVIEFNDKDERIVPRILMHSNDSHIYKEGLPLDYDGKGNI